MNPRIATQTLWVVFNSASFGATTYGIASQIGGGEITLRSTLMAAGIALIIQTIVMLGWPVVGRAMRRGAIVTLFVMALVSVSGSIFSGTFASTTYIKATRAAFLDEEFDAGLVERATKVLQPVTGKAEALKDKMLSYQRFAEGESLKESRTGDSCDGVKAASICGPICNLRAEQAKDAREQANAMRGLVSRIDNLRAGAVAITSQDQLVELTGASNGFLRDPLIDRVTEWAANEKEGFAGRGFEWEGKLRQCRDTAAVARLDEILAIAGQAIDPASTPKLRDQNFADVAAKNLEGISGVVQASLDGGVEGFRAAIAEDPAKQFLPLWVVSLVIETVCACLGLALVRRPDPFGGPDTDGEPYDPRKAAVASDTWNRCVFWQGNQQYFFVPYDGDENLRNNALHLLDSLPSKPFVRRGPIPIADLMTDGEAERYAALTGASLCEAHVITNPTKAGRKIAFGRTFVDPTNAEPV